MCVAELVARLTAGVDVDRLRRAIAQPIAGSDVLVVAPYNAQVSRLAERLAAHGRARRNGGQVSGPGGAGRHLLDGDVAPGRRAARDGVPVQPQSPERRDVAGAVRRRFSSRPRACSSRSVAARDR